MCVLWWASVGASIVVRLFNYGKCNILLSSEMCLRVDGGGCVGGDGWEEEEEGTERVGWR